MATLAKFSAQSITTDADKSAHSFVLTGKPGIGKTFLLSTIPRMFILPIEEGLKGASPDHEVAHYNVVPTSLVELEQALEAFGVINAPGPNGRRPYLHLGIDSLSGIESLIHAQACAQEGVSHMEGKGYGAVFAAALPLYGRIQKRLNTIRRSGTNVWVVAHAQEASEANEDGEMYRRWDLAFRGPPAKAGEVRNIWRQWADHVLFLDWDVSVRTQKGKRTVGKLRARIIRTKESGFAFAKTRSRIPETLPATWEDLQRAMQAGSAAPEPRVRQQVEDVLAKLTEEANVLAIRADLSSAKGANRMAAVLSRAQGMLAVERAAQAEASAEAPDDAAGPAVSAQHEEAPDDAAGPAVSAQHEEAPDAPPEAFDQTDDASSVDSMDAEIEGALIARIADAPTREILMDLVPDITRSGLPCGPLDRVRSAYGARMRAVRVP